MPNSGRRGLPRAIPVVLAVIGALLILYPLVCNAIFQLVQVHSEIVYQEAILNEDPQEIEDKWQAALAYNQALAVGSASADSSFGIESDDAPCEALLGVEGQDSIGVVKLERLVINQVICAGTADVSLEQGAGHVAGSALPVGGLGTHCVLAGHTGLPSGMIFDRLDQAQLGDIITLEVLGHTLYYRVFKIDVVLPEDVDSLAADPNEDLLTLVTCTPYGVNDHRLLVHAVRCVEAELEEGVVDFGWWSIAGYAVTLMLLAGVVFFLHKRHGKLLIVNYGKHGRTR